MTEKKKLTVAEAADELGVNRQRVYELCATEQIEHYRYPGRNGAAGTIRIDRAAIDRFLAACKRPAQGRTA